MQQAARPQGKIRILIAFFCVAFFIWKSPTLITLNQNLKLFFSTDSSNLNTFPPITTEILEFQREHHTESFALSKTMQEGLIYFQNYYALWPTKVNPDAEILVLKKEEPIPTGFIVTQSGYEVNFVQRSH